MSKRLALALLAVGLLTAPAAANGPLGFTVGGSASFSFYIAPYGGPGGGGAMPAQAGPWYLYWPMEAHFVAPAPTGYPYWPSGMTLPDGNTTASPGAFPSFAQGGGFGPAAPYYWGSR